VSVGNSLLRRYAGGAELLPEEIFDIAAREMCRFKRGRDCAALLARWSVDYSDSRFWRATLSALRKAERARISSLTIERFATLRALYSGRVIPRDDAAPPHVEALRVTNLFLNYYSHVLPFDRRVLEEAWGRCGGEDCEAARARAEKLLWALDGSASR
jgi:hypothetical protein